jgi:hypothetical protein
MPIDFKKRAVEQKSRAIENDLAPVANGAVELTGDLVGVRVVNTGSGWGFGRILEPRSNIDIPFTGIVSSLYDTARVTIRGRWKEHDKYGWQIEAQAVVVDLPADNFGVRMWFETHFPDIGPQRAASIIATFPPPGLWEVIEQTPERLEECEGIGPKLRESISLTYEFVKAERECYIELVNYGLKAEHIREAVKRWGRQTPKTLKEDPYRLVEVDVPFKIVDGLGLRNGINRRDPRRIVAGHVFAMKQIEQDGHTCASIKALQSGVASSDVLSLSLRDVIAQWPAVVERQVLAEVAPGVVSLAYRAAQERSISDFVSSVVELTSQSC